MHILTDREENKLFAEYRKRMYEINDECRKMVYNTLIIMRQCSNKLREYERICEKRMLTEEEQTHMLSLYDDWHDGYMLLYTLGHRVRWMGNIIKWDKDLAKKHRAKGIKHAKKVES